MPATSTAMHTQGGFALGAHGSHDAVVVALRNAPAAGLAADNPSATAQDPTQVATREIRLSRAPVLTAAQRGLLPRAVVSSAAAAVTSVDQEMNPR